MNAPRLKVGVFGDTGVGDLLQAAGHTVTPLALDEPAAATHCDLIVLAAHGEELEELANNLAPCARRGQMYMHTAFEYGVAVLDPVEVSGAIVFAAHQLTDTVWATAAADELGETIVGLLVAEMGGTAMMVTEQQRVSVQAAMTYRQLADIMHNDAITLLNDALDHPDAAEALIPPTTPSYLLPTIDQVARQHASISDAGRAHMFAALVLRYADMYPNPDLELWAISQLNYKE